MFEVTERLYRGPRPESFKRLQEQGFERVIDLQSGAENCLTESVYEHEDPSDYGIQRISYQWSNVFCPTRAQVKSFLFDIGLNGRKTYVHCHSGVDRTGFAIACYRMRKMNWQFDRAYKEWVVLGRHWWFDWWKYEMKKYEL